MKVSRLKDYDYKKINKSYDDIIEEAKVLVNFHIDALRKELSRYKKISLEEMEDEIKSFKNSIPITEMRHTEFEETEGLKNSYYLNRVASNEKDYYFPEIKILIEEKELELARERYFIANHLSPSQIEEYIEYYREYLLESTLKNAREEIISKYLRYNRKESKVFDEYGIKDDARNIIFDDLDEIDIMPSLGKIERVKLLDERQNREKKEIIKAIEEIGNDIDEMVLFGVAPFGIAYILHCLNPNSPFLFFGSGLFGYAAALAMLGVRNFNKNSPTVVIEEAKKLGLYESLIKTEEKLNQYRKYVRSVYHESEFTELKELESRRGKK